ncbi:S-layer homology domain-containing protein [Veillonella sp. CNR 79/14]|uniref:S-layer homology domain-containing protein n=1 Tax=Veillonella sp. CNR 79/14 TaxID=2490954 RepID=UPI000F8D92EF|nr:S-layer homology domain-containing protein [Veillonella sp. CNR 79/14]
MKRIYSALLLTALPIVLLQAQTSNSLSTSTMVTTPNTFTYSQPNTISTFDRVQKYRFTDVPSNFWAYESITKMTKEGIMSGYRNGTFKPNDPLSREEAASLFSNMIGDTPSIMLASSFSDITSDRWSSLAIESVARANIISGYGDNTYRPEQYMSRQEFAVVADKFLHYQGYRTEDPTALDAIHFSDQKFIAPWAQSSVRELALWGFINYSTKGLFNPEKYITRGEAAEITYRLLFSKEATAIQHTIQQQQMEETARALVKKTFGENYDFHHRGAMFWRDGKLVISFTSSSDVKAITAETAYIKDKHFLDNHIITTGSYSLGDFDNLQTDAAYLYRQLEPHGTILAVTPTPNVDGLILTVDKLDATTQTAFMKKFGKKVQLKTNS